MVLSGRFTCDPWEAREESTKIMSIRFAQRDAVKHDMKQDRHFAADPSGSDDRTSGRSIGIPWAV